MRYTKAFSSLMEMMRMAMLVWTATTGCSKVDNGYHAINNKRNIAIAADQGYTQRSCFVEYAVYESNLETFAKSIHNIVTCMVPPEGGRQHESAICLSAILMALLNASPQSDEAYLKVTLAKIDTVSNALASCLKREEPDLGQKFRSLIDDHIFHTVSFKKALLTAVTSAHVAVVDRMLAGIVKIYESEEYPILYQLFSESENVNKLYPILHKAVLRNSNDSAAMVYCVVKHLEYNARHLPAIKNCFLDQSVPYKTAKYHHTALHLAVVENKLDVVQCLLQLGSDPNVQDSAGDTPLHLAIKMNNLAIARYFLEHDAQASLEDKSKKIAPSIIRVFTRALNFTQDLLHSKDKSVIPYRMRVLELEELLKELSDLWHSPIHGGQNSALFLERFLKPALARWQLPCDVKQFDNRIETILGWLNLCKDVLSSPITLQDLNRCDSVNAYGSDGSHSVDMADELRSCDSSGIGDSVRSCDGERVCDSAKTYDSERICDSATTIESHGKGQILHGRQHLYASPLLAS